MSTQRKIHAGLPSRAASGFLFEELEPRLLLSADSPLNVADDYAPIAAPEQASLQEVLAAAYPSASVASVSGIRQELVFVDTDTPEYQQLLEDLLDNQDASRRFQVILLDNDSDGIAQITDALSEYRSLDGVHIISHGSDDSIDIGNTRFDIDALRANAAAVQAWGEAFSENGDFLIYGCNLAANSQGRALVDSLARLTGVDVAASDDLTGSAQIGADWDLEYSQGQIETLVAFSQSLQMTWENALATYTVTSTLDDGSPGTLRWAIEQANLNAGVDTVNFDINVGDANHYYYADDGIAGQVTHDGTHVLTTTASDDATIVGIDPDFAKSWYTISPTSMLSVTDTLVLDGTTQAGFVDTPIIELNGSIAGAAASGLHIESDNSTVRGLVINRFGEEGIQILMGNGNTIEGNYIGTDVSGTVDLGNIAQGISIVLSTDNVIGGSTAAQRNVISGNDQAGIIVWDVTTTGTVIQGNYIGVDASGTRALGNTDGIVVDFDSSNTIIGGDAAAGEGNLISGNSRNGIEIYDAGNNTVAGNRIGTDVTGTLDLGNARSGIAIGGYSTANIIGGLTAGESNVISGNDWSGIEITGTATGNAILRNSIYANTLLGIDLNADGVTANDVNDADTGPGNLQNFPLLTTAVTDGAASVIIDGTLSGTAGTSYRIEFFANNVADASGHGEGERYLGFVSVTTDGGGSAAISASLTASVAAGEYITATATVDNVDSTYGDTSEFSANLVAMPANAEPVTDDSSAAGNEDAVSISITLTGSDSDGSVEFFRLSNLPANGTLFTDAGLTTVAVTGADYAATTEALTLWFVPDSDWNGVTTFQYVAGDDGGAVDASPATATITVSSVNDTPTTTGIADVSVNEDTLVTFIDLKTKFDDVEDADASLVYTITNNTNPGLVSTSIGGSGGLNINYAADQSGTADITVRATDTGGLFVETSFTVTVNPVNDAPVAVDDAYNVVEGSGGFLPPAGVLLNDTDIDSGTLTAIQLSNVAHGNLTLNSSGSWWYTPDPDYNGTDSFTYKANDGSLDSNVATVTLNIAPRNDPPAGADSTVTTLEDTDYVFSSTDFGFSDPVEGDAFLAVRITTLPDAGTLTLTGSGAVAAGDFINTTDIDAGKLVFTPAADANGTGYASFSFQVQDDGGTSNGGVDLGPTANTMTIDVTPVADAPVITSNGGGDTGATSVVENTAYVTTVTATDADLPAETLTYSITGGPDAVDFSIDGSTGVLTFVNAPDYENPQGSLSGGWVYQVVVQVSDVSLSDTQTLDILVSNTNDPPIITSNGGGDTANVVVPENSAVVTTVTATDQDSGIQPLTYSISGGADAARFNIDSQTGALGLAAPPDYEVPTDNGSDNTYEVIVEVSDVNGATDAQTIHVSVDDVNEAPAANNDVILAGEDSGQTAVAPGLVSNDTDPEGNAGLYIYAVDGNTASVNSTITLASGALLTVNADGSTSYVSNGAFEYLGAGESAIDTFTYTIADAGGLTSTATVTVSIVGVNDAPVINGLSGSLNAVENSTAVTTVTANDADSDPLVYSVSGGTDAALFSINSATGELSFIAAPDFELPGDSDSNNVYEVEVSADDGNGGVDTLQISVEITDVNDNAPGIETGLIFAVPEDAANGVSPGAATATDVDTVGSLQNWQIVSGNSAGVFAINESTGEITVTDRSALDYENNSSYAIGLQVSDGINISSIETVTIDVININEAPSHTVPGAQTTSMNTSLAFSSLDGNGISISDPDASVVEVTLSVTNGNLTLSGTGGLTFSAGDGESDATMTFTGAADAVNAALDGLLFQPDMEFLGFANLTVITDDRGESGSGGPMTTMNTVTIAVLEVAGAPDILEAIPTLDALVHDFGEPHQLTIVSDMLAASPYRNELSSETTDTAPEAGAGSSGSTESPVVPDPGLNETMPGQAGTSLLRPYGQIQFSEPESDSDRSSASVLVQRAVRQALADPLLIAGTLVPEAPLWSVLDLMLAQMNSDDGVAQTREDVIVKSAQGLTFTLTAGYVSWLLRAGYLSASLLSIAPLWRQFDPLPILARPVKDKSKPAGNPQEQPGSDEITAEEVFMTSRNTA